MDPFQRGYRQARLEFIRKCFRLWLVISLVSLGIGNGWGECSSHCSDNTGGMLLVSCGVFLFSLLLCRGISDFLWFNRRSNALIFGLTIPMAAVAPITIGGHLLSGSQYMGALLRNMCGALYVFVLMYAGGVIWGLLVGGWRKRAFQNLGVPTQ
jgi:hypothetical protein